MRGHKTKSRHQNSKLQRTSSPQNNKIDLDLLSRYFPYADNMLRRDSGTQGGDSYTAEMKDLERLQSGLPAHVLQRMLDEEPSSPTKWNKQLSMLVNMPSLGSPTKTRK